MNPQKLLIVAESPDVHNFLLDTLGTRHEVTEASAAEEAMRALQVTMFDVMIVDGDLLFGSAGLSDLFNECDSTALPVCLAVTDGTGLASMKAVELGAFDAVDSLMSVEHINQVVRRAADHENLKRENRKLVHRVRETDPVSSFVGNSIAIQRIREKLRLVASSNACVLITGESGTGKELAAREIHRMSARAEGPFVKVNCATLPAALIENELFGQDMAPVSGSPVPGKVELAHGGTLLLEDVGQLPASAQAKLVSIIQEGELARDSGGGPIRVDVRVIATSERTLKPGDSSGRVSDELLYRLNVVPIEIPPLRERAGDIPLLVAHFVSSFARRNGRPPIRLTAGALKKLASAYWRGNVRELENMIERAVILAGGATLDENYFRFDDEREEQMSQLVQTFRHGSIRDMEKLMIVHRLVDRNENRTRAAESLEISVRTLRNKLREYRETSREGTLEARISQPR